MELPTDVEVSKHVHRAAIAGVPVVLAAREAQHGARLHEAVAHHMDAGVAQGPPQGDHREVSVEVDRLAEAKVVLQEERDALRGIFWGQDGQRWPQALELRMKSAVVMRIMKKLCESCECQSNLLQKSQDIL